MATKYKVSFCSLRMTGVSFTHTFNAAHFGLIWFINRQIRYFLQPLHQTRQDQTLLALWKRNCKTFLFERAAQQREKSYFSAGSKSTLPPYARFHIHANSDSHRDLFIPLRPKKARRVLIARYTRQSPHLFGERSSPQILRADSAPPLNVRQKTSRRKCSRFNLQMLMKVTK